jgi:hypothetical protein
VPALLASLPMVLAAAAVAVASLQLGIRHGLAWLVRAPWVFVTMGCAAGAGIAIEALSPAKSEVAMPVPAHVAVTPAPLVIAHCAPGLEPLQQTDRAA